MPRYDHIGPEYSRYRIPDPRIGAAIQDALGDAASLVNVGAGTGAYEPADRRVIAVEPSAAMVARRRAGTAPCVRAWAHALPIRDAALDAALAVLTIHHWADWRAGVAELRRVARKRLVVFTWTPAAGAFWFLRDYLTGVYERDGATFPPMEEFGRVASGAVEVRPVLIPWDCTDGFLGAYWRRPEAYLDAGRAAAMSALAVATPAVRHALARLGDDLASGRWAKRNAALLAQDELDIGYRLLVVRY